jgi:hypothetical protein
MRVPWLARNSIAGQASDLLAGYEDFLGCPIMPPIPVETIIEQYLGLNLSFENLDQKLGLEDVLGATYVKSKKVCINQ